LSLLYQARQKCGFNEHNKTKKIEVTGKQTNKQTKGPSKTMIPQYGFKKTKENTHMREKKRKKKGKGGGRRREGEGDRLES